MVKAAVFLGSENIEIREFHKPKISSDCALLKVTHCGVCGTDPHIYSGHLTVPTPIILGHEFSGILEEIGPDFPKKDILGNNLKEGDAVTIGTSLACGTCYYCRFTPHRSNLCEKVDIYGITMTSEKEPHLFGGYSEYVNLYPNTWVYKLPERISLEVSALADPYACATRTLERAFQPGLPWAWDGFGSGKSVVVQGLGPIGILACAAAKTAGAYPIIGIDAVPLRMEISKKFGVDELIDLGKVMQAEDRVEHVQKLTGGRGADVVLEMAGIPAAFAESLQLVRPGGKVVEFGHFTDVGTVPINPQHIVNKDVDILGVFAYGNAQIATSLALLESTSDRFPYGDLITHKFSLDDVKAAIEASRNKTCIKSVVTPNPAD
jgi:L-iditol 2-dehydrogenase